MTDAPQPTGPDDLASLGLQLEGTLIERMGIEVLEASP